MYETKEERDALFGFTGKFSEVDLLNKSATGFGWAVLVQDNFEAQRLKVVKLPNREETTRELLAEAQILTKIAQYLRHPNLIELGAVERYVIEWHGKKEERWFLVLQFGGDNLRRRLGKLGMRGDDYVYHGGAAMPLDEMLDIAIQIADGLRALHDFEEAPGQHIIHRDIKPENILIDKQGTARLTDFGISKVVERINTSITLAGTPPYLPPESSRGRLKAASDIYALGIVLYEMATGQFPFRRFEDRFYDLPAAPHSINPQVPASVSDVIMRCLWWDPHAARGQEEADRYQRAAELLQDLRRCYSRLHPVPPQFQLVCREGRPTHVYHDKNSGGDVRIFLYETNQPGLCASRLTSMIGIDCDDVTCPRQTFEAEDQVGVVVPMAHTRESSADTGTVLSGQAVYLFVERIQALCRKLDELHRLGIYHGMLNPKNARLDGDRWWIDELWLGALAGAAKFESVITTHEVPQGYLAPEMLRWRSPPTLSCDIYGLGAILYGHLSGRAPFDAAAVTTLGKDDPLPPSRAASGMRELAPTVSRRLEAIILKALHPDPAARYRSLDQFLGELAGCRWPGDAIHSLIEDAKDAQKQGKLVEAYDSLDQAQILDAGNPDVHHARAEIYFLEGAFKHALRENAKAQDISPTCSVWLLTGQCLSALGNHQDAVWAFREGLDKEDCSRGRHLLAKALEHIGQNREALEEYRQAARIAELVERDQVRLREISTDLSALMGKIKP